MSSSGFCTASGDGCPMKAEIKSLLYWRRPLRSAVVLIALLLVQLSFVLLSAISVVAYAGFLLFVLVNLCRLYHTFVTKTESQLIRDYFEHPIQLPKERISDVTGRLTDLTNDLLRHTREVILLTNVGASIKFGVLLYVMTYVGAYFNLLTLCIVGTLLAFLVPKFYESYQNEIDHALKVVREKVGSVCSKAYKQISTKLDNLPILGSRKNKTQ